MCLGGLADDRETEARARHPARVARAVEALEDVRQVAVRKARAVIADAQLAVRQADVDGPTCWAPLDRVVDEVRDRPLDACGLSADHGGLELRAELEPVTRAGTRALDHRTRDLVDAHVVDGVAGLGATGELDDVRDERRQLVELLDDVRPQGFALGLRQALRLLQRLDVRSQACDRGAQLVARVRHQPALSFHRALERIERGVEAARKPRQLVVAAHLDPLGRVGVGGELLSTPREAGDRGERGARDDRPEPRAERDARGADHEQHEHDAVELPVDLVERAGHLDGPAAGQPGREHAQVDTFDVRVADVLPLPGPRDLERVLICRESARGAGPAQHAAARQHDLRVCLRRPAEGRAPLLGQESRDGRPAAGPCRDRPCLDRSPARPGRAASDPPRRAARRARRSRPPAPPPRRRAPPRGRPPRRSACAASSGLP